MNSGAVLRVGSGGFVNNDLRLNCYRSIEIGDRVIVAEGVTIRDSDDHQVDGRDRTAPVVIGDDVWIGLRATVLKGVTIGRGRSSPPAPWSSGTSPRAPSWQACPPRSSGPA